MKKLAKAVPKSYIELRL